MPRQGGYVDNAMNRSLGRVGMAYGTAVHSRSSGSSYSMSSPGTYVDNAMNRSLGRVGMEYGTAVHSRSSNSSYSMSSPGTYVDNAMNRSLGRVGMEYGTAVHSRSSSSSYSMSSPGTYVDNAMNRSLGRVGMDYGTAVHSRSSVASPGVYVDNPMNRSLGRVGMAHGTAVHSRSSGMSVSSKSNTGCGGRTYVDNAYNRRMGRVGKELGTHVISKSVGTPSTRSSSSTQPKQKQTYVDNALNRKLGRVGMPLGSMPHSTTDKSKMLKDLFPVTFEQIIPAANDYDADLNFALAYQEIERRRNICSPGNESEIHDVETLQLCDQMENVINRREAAKSKKYDRLNPPSWLRSGEVINYADLEIGDQIGSGGFGNVHVAIWKGEMKVCVKVFRVQRVREQKRKQFEEEVKQLSSLNHPAIVSFYGACVTTPKLAIVMEFMGQGSLHDVIHIDQKQFADPTKFQLAKDMLSALKYIHSLNTVHRDVKSSNVLMCDNLDHCKLSDFGLALKEEVENNSSVADHTVVGTLKYSPFEVIEGERLTVNQFKAVDVYSTALTILELMTERSPFDGLNQHQIRNAIRKGDNKDLELIDNLLLKNLLAKCLDKRPSNRPSASQFMQLLDETADLENWIR